MHTIHTKFKAKQNVWLATAQTASVQRVKIHCVSVTDYGDKINAQYQIGNNWYDEQPSERCGLFTSKKDADKFVLKGAASLKELRVQKALQRIQFQADMLEQAKAEYNLAIQA